MRAAVLIAVLYGAVQALGLTVISDARAEQPASGSQTRGSEGVLPWERDEEEAEERPGEQPETAPIRNEAGSTPRSKPEDRAGRAPKAEPAHAGEAEVKAETDSTDEGEAASSPAPKSSAAPTSAAGPRSEQGVDTSASVEPPAPAHPVVALIREKLDDDAVTKDADGEDVAALQQFYRVRSGPPLWVTEMGFTARGQAAIFEIEQADDWGLDAEDFRLPDADALPADETAQALAEIELGLAVLKYARFARGGRYVPVQISRMFDQKPTLREPGSVIAEIAGTGSPPAYLQSLHPHHEQFRRLREALVKARSAKTPNQTDIRRLIINMERWRWMPEDLGAFHVWLNTPEFMLYLRKDGETVYTDKTLVGTQEYATPIFTAEMETVVFNPDWVAPPSVLRDKLWPALKRKSYGILTSNKLNVSYKGKRIDPKKVDWNRVNIHNYTFSQKAGPKNVLGKAKFLYPNRHIVYMHDTLPSWDKSFKKDKRAVGNACVRMENPRKFAELLLAQDQELPSTKVQSLWSKGVNSAVKMTTKPPVHTTYFTVTVDEDGKVSTFKDLYGLDRKSAKAFFGTTAGFPAPPPEPKQRASTSVASSETPRPSSGGGFANSLDFFSN